MAELTNKDPRSRLVRSALGPVMCWCWRGLSPEPDVRPLFALVVSVGSGLDLCLKRLAPH